MTKALVRMMHRRAHLSEQIEARVDGEHPTVAPRIDGCPVDVLHGQPGHAVVGGPAVDQLRDVGVLQLRENLSFRAKTLKQPLRIRTTPQRLDGPPLPERIVGPFGEIHRAHAPRPMRCSTRYDPTRRPTRLGADVMSAVFPSSDHEASGMVNPSSSCAE